MVNGRVEGSGRANEKLQFEGGVMVNGLDFLYIALSSIVMAPQSSLPLIHPSTHTLIHQWATAAMQCAARPIGSNLGFSVLPEDTLACGHLEPGFEPLTFEPLDNPLYQLSTDQCQLEGALNRSNEKKKIPVID